MSPRRSSGVWRLGPARRETRDARRFGAEEGMSALSSRRSSGVWCLGPGMSRFDCSGQSHRILVVFALLRRRSALFGSTDRGIIITIAFVENREK